MFSKRFLLSVGAVAGAAMLSTNVEADSVISKMKLGLNTAEDTNREYLLDRTGAANIIDVGDSLSGILSFGQLNGAVQDLGTTDNHWDVVFQTLVATKAATFDGPGGAFSGFAYTFVPDPTFKVNGALAGPGVMGVFFEDAPGTTNLGDGNDNGGVPLSIAAATASVEDGSRFWSLGFTGPKVLIPALDGLGDWDNSGFIDAGDTGFLFTSPVAFPGGEGWTGRATTAGVLAGAPGDDIIPFKTLGQSPTLAEFDTALTRINLPGTPETGDSIILGTVLTTFGIGEFSLEGGIGGIEGLGPVDGVEDDTNFDLSSGTVMTFSVLQIVPEPITSSMGLMGLGALSMIARRRRIA